LTAQGAGKADEAIFAALDLEAFRVGLALPDAAALRAGQIDPELIAVLLPLRLVLIEQLEPQASAFPEKVMVQALPFGIDTRTGNALTESQSCSSASSNVLVRLRVETVQRK
jgi:hypothetical protein